MTANCICVPPRPRAKLTTASPPTMRSCSSTYAPASTTGGTRAATAVSVAASCRRRTTPAADASLISLPSDARRRRPSRVPRGVKCTRGPRGSEALAGAASGTGRGLRRSPRSGADAARMADGSSQEERPALRVAEAMVEWVCVLEV